MQLPLLLLHQLKLILLVLLLQLLLVELPLVEEGQLLTVYLLILVQLLELGHHGLLGFLALGLPVLDFLLLLPYLRVEEGQGRLVHFLLDFLLALDLLDLQRDLLELLPVQAVLGLDLRHCLALLVLLGDLRLCLLPDQVLLELENVLLLLLALALELLVDLVILLLKLLDVLHELLLQLLVVPQRILVLKILHDHLIEELVATGGLKVLSEFLEALTEESHFRYDFSAIGFIRVALELAANLLRAVLDLPRLVFNILLYLCQLCPIREPLQLLPLLNQIKILVL